MNRHNVDLTPIVLGVDPGEKGAATVVGYSKRNAQILDKISFKDYGKQWPIEFSKWLKGVQYPLLPVFLERAGARPEQGVSTTFSFGRNYGVVQGSLISCGFSFKLVHPGSWTRHIWNTDLIIGLQSRFEPKDPKEYSRIMAEHIFGWEPFKKKPNAKTYDSGVVDSSLIGLYGCMVTAGEIALPKNVVETDLDFQNYP